jgi:GT2 family glycosyltransferase
LKTIAAVVVTYNRKALLLECLEALASSDGTEELLQQHNFMERISYERLEYNGRNAFE